MANSNQTLEVLFEKVRSLPAERQQQAIMALEDITSAPVSLTEDEIRIVRAALLRAQRGEFAGDAEMADLLDQPWT